MTASSAAMAKLGLFLLCLVAVAVVIGPALYAVSPTEQSLLETLKRPTFAHLLGTDQYGRDVLARILHGGRVSLLAALVIVASALLIGGVIGWIASSERVIGRLVTRGIDMLLSLPSLIVALAVVGALGVGLPNLVFAFVLVGWPWYARIVRGLAVERRKSLDILASRAFGVRATRIFTGHVVPHLIRTLVIVAALDLGYTVAGLAAFSYLGLGAQPPAPEWGAMLNDAQLYFVVAPWLLAGPAFAIALTVLATSLVADHLHGQGLAR